MTKYMYKTENVFIYDIMHLILRKELHKKFQHIF